MERLLMIKNVRCSFPRLYSAEVKDGDTFSPGITVVLEKVAHASAIKAVWAKIHEAIENNTTLKKQPPKGEKICLRRPDSEELLYKEDNLILKANNEKPPVVLHPDGVTIMNETTDMIYSGCYVNIKVDIWGQSNKFGRRVNAKLIAVQFVPREASSFDGSYISPDEAAAGFDSLDDGAESMSAGFDEDDLLG